MFSRSSRYRKVPDVVTTDVAGRPRRSKAFRPLPTEVSGTFLHTVVEGDRLDHLAYQYYAQPQKWWRICDANPAFMSPLALLDTAPLVTTRFALTYDNASQQPPWAALLQTLTACVGVEDVRVVEDIRLVPNVQTIQDQQVTIHVEYYERAVIVTYNACNISARQLRDVIATSGFGAPYPPESTGRVGKQIVIPPDDVG